MRTLATVLLLLVPGKSDPPRDLSQWVRMNCEAAPFWAVNIVLEPENWPPGAADRAFHYLTS